MLCALKHGTKHRKPTTSNKLRGLLRKKRKKHKNRRKQSGNLILLGGPHLTGLGL